MFFKIFTFKKNVLRQLLLLEIVSVTKVKNKLFRCMYKVMVEKKMKQGLCLVLLNNAFIFLISVLNYEVSQILTPIFL